MDSYRRSAIFTVRNLRLRITGRELLLTLSIIAAASAVAFVVRPWKGEVTGALIFMLGITLSGAICGVASAVMAALAAFFLYNFYFAEPVLVFRIENGVDVAPLIVFSLCAIVTGVLAGRLRDYAEAADRSNAQLISLLGTSRALQTAVRLEDIQAALSRVATAGADFSVQLFQATPDRLVEPHPGEQGHDPALYSLTGSTGPVGSMLVAGASAVYPERAFMEAFASVVALAVERAALMDEITESRASARTEELKTALLASVSHDFRTPLTTIRASASSLIEYRDQLDPQTALGMLRGIVDECERLNRYTANLLELSRLETGLVATHFQHLVVSDVINSVLQRMRPRFGNREIIRKFRHGDLLVTADTALFELALVNIFDNAIAYGEDGTRVLIECESDGADCLVSVSDEGRGIEPHQIDKIFDRFYRAAGQGQAPRGSGLGLSIVKGFVEALGGSVRAETPGIDGKGTRIVIRIPAIREPATI